MFVGQYQFTLDTKKRLVVPAKFRAFFPPEEKERGVFATAQSVEYDDIHSNHLVLYTPADWHKHADWIAKSALQSEEAKWYLRKISSDTEFCKIDAQWRVVIPLRLINAAELKRDIMITGAVDRIEVWDLAKWREVSEWLKEHSTGLEKHIYERR